jgi:kynureninase
MPNLADLGYQLGSPRDDARRGGHVSIRHRESYRIYQALTRELKLIPDFREPDNIRLGFAPLYTSFGDVLEAVVRLRPGPSMSGSMKNTPSTERR